MTDTPSYDKACAAFAEALRVDDAAGVDVELAKRIYARRALNREPEMQALKIRLRAERRLQQLAKELHNAGQLTPELANLANSSLRGCLWVPNCFDAPINRRF